MEDQHLLDIKSCKIYFIYSFIITYNDLLPSIDQYKILFENSGDPIDRTGLSAYLVLKLPAGYERWPAIIGKLEEKEIFITPLFRCFPSGCSLTLELSVSAKENEYLSDQFVYELQHLTSIENNSIAKKIIALDSEISENGKKSYNFKENIDKIRSLVSNKTELPITIFEIARKIIDVKKEEWNQNDKTRGKIKILCQEYLKEINTVEERQTPWVITAIEVSSNSNAAKDFFGKYHGTLEEKYNKKVKKIQKYEHIIAPILYRAPNELVGWNPEPAFNISKNNMENHLSNLYLLSDLFIQISRRSILLLTENFKTHPCNYILPTILNIAEMIHTRWQNLIIMNVMLDEKIRKISYNDLSSHEKYEIIVDAINNSFQSLENRLNYIVSGNVLREISNELSDTFKLNELTESLVKKIDLLQKAIELSSRRNLFTKLND